MAKRQSAVYRRKNLSAGQSEIELAALVKSRLGIDIEPAKLRQFVCDKFVILSILCHEIHAAEQSAAVSSALILTPSVSSTDQRESPNGN